MKLMGRSTANKEIFKDSLDNLNESHSSPDLTASPKEVIWRQPLNIVMFGIK